ncbi:MAG: M23 family metallopeptidase [Candidatus Borkfalkiaceae bacterium]|nr:M23 family metallopeptidase [Clostridia bacterium]MDY6223910.1 M23 family metallopeptidase [Christensenellaceae bacterium]
MKEHEKTEKKGTRSYFYAILGCIAVLLAAAIVITAIALSGKKQNVIEAPDPSQSEEPVTPDDPVGPADPVTPDEPVIVEPEGFYSPVAEMNVLNQYEFYYNKTLNCYHLHSGIDFSATAGDTVFAADDGVVEETYSSDLLCGGKIVIRHADNVYTVYEYVDVAANLKAGDTITRGQAIGTVAAATGAEYKEGAHLHFEVLQNGSAVDPASFLTMEEK